VSALVSIALGFVEYENVNYEVDSGIPTVIEIMLNTSIFHLKKFEDFQIEWHQSIGTLGERF
jgi:hypothetical protein